MFFFSYDFTYRSRTDAILLRVCGLVGVGGGRGGIGMHKSPGTQSLRSKIPKYYGNCGMIGGNFEEWPMFHLLNVFITLE